MLTRSCTERADMLKAARGGGSITPRFAKSLQQHVRAGRLEILTNTSITSQSYSAEARTWCLETDPPVPNLPPIDYIYFATGVKSDITTLPFIQTILAKQPISVIDGMPALTDDLAWSDGIPLFLTGKFAGLRLGPGAANLEGARAGAERIALAIESMLEAGKGWFGASDPSDSGHGVELGEEDQESYASGLRNMFESLRVDGESPL